MDHDITDIQQKVLAGERLDFEDGCRLFRHSHLPELAMLADWVRQRKHPHRIVTYNIGRNINYTNVCWVQCGFCAFYRRPGSEDGYTLPKEVIWQKIQELVDVGGDQPGSCEILMQGGLNPKLRLEYFEDLLADIKARFPQVHLHSLSAPEVLYLAHLSRLSVPETLRRLRDAGLDSLPGAGAEILVDAVRQEIAPRKDTTEEWLSVHRAAHELGMNTTATMMYGSVETVEQRVEHLLRVRETQDAALGEEGCSRRGRPRAGPQARGRFTAFIPWSWQPDGTALGERCGWRKASGYDYLRTVAVSRLMLDNIDHLQASYVTQGPRIAQIALHYGLDDFGSTMMEENVVSAANTNFLMPIQEIERLIREAGYEPRRRNTRYEYV